MKQDELEILRSIMAQLNKGLEYINTGRIRVGYECIHLATSDLNTMLSMMGVKNGKE